MIEFIAGILAAASLGLMLYWWDIHEHKRFKEWEKFERNLENSVRRANKAQWN